MKYIFVGPVSANTQLTHPPFNISLIMPEKTINIADNNISEITIHLHTHIYIHIIYIHQDFVCQTMMLSASKEKQDGRSNTSAYTYTSTYALTHVKDFTRILEHE